MKAIEYIKGKRTYIMVGLGAVVLALNLVGVIEQDTMATILTALGMGGVVTLRLAIANIAKK